MPFTSGTAWSTVGARLVRKEGKRLGSADPGSDVAEEQVLPLHGKLLLHSIQPPAYSSSGVPVSGSSSPCSSLSRASDSLHQCADGASRASWCWSWKPCVQMTSPTPSLRGKPQADDWSCPVQVLPHRTHGCTGGQQPEEEDSSTVSGTPGCAD